MEESVLCRDMCYFHTINEIKIETKVIAKRKTEIGCLTKVKIESLEVLGLGNIRWKINVFSHLSLPCILTEVISTFDIN